MIQSIILLAFVLGFHSVYGFEKPNVVTVMLTYIVAKSDGEKGDWF